MNAIRQRFADEHGMPIKTVNKLCRLGTDAARMNEYVCNGDPHNGCDRNDKNACAAAWERDLEAQTKAIADLVSPFGFSVEYNGLYPSLSKDGRHFHIPY